MKIFFLSTAIFCCCAAMAQQQVTLDEAIAIGLKNNPAMHMAGAEIERQQALKRTATEIPKTDVMYMRGQYNSIIKTDNNVTVSQTIPFPTVFGSQRALGAAQVRSAEAHRQMQENELLFSIRQTFMEILFLQARHQLLMRQDSLFEGFVRSSSLRYKTGEGTLLEKTSAETQRAEIQNLIRMNDGDQSIALYKLKMYLNQDIDGVTGTLQELALTDSGITANPQLRYWVQQVIVADKQRKVDRAKALPDIKVGYFNQTLIGYQTVNGQEQYFGGNKRFQGFEVGLALPLWFVPHTSRVQAAKINVTISEHQRDLTVLALKGRSNEAIQEYNKNRSSLAYYKDTALPNAKLLSRQNILAFKNGESDYSTFLMNARTVLSIEEGFLQALHQYNQSIIYLQFLSGNPIQ